MRSADARVSLTHYTPVCDAVTCLSFLPSRCRRFLCWWWAALYDTRSRCQHAPAFPALSGGRACPAPRPPPPPPTTASRQLLPPPRYTPVQPAPPPQLSTAAPLATMRACTNSIKALPAPGTSDMTRNGGRTLTILTMSYAGMVGGNALLRRASHTCLRAQHLNCTAPLQPLPAPSPSTLHRQGAGCMTTGSGVTAWPSLPAAGITLRYLSRAMTSVARNSCRAYRLPYHWRARGTSACHAGRHLYVH